MAFSRISAALAAGAIAVTITVAYLLTEPQARGDSFFLSLGFILLAELFLFAGPHLVRTGGGVQMAPWHIGMSAVPVLYAIGVGCITVAAVCDTPWRILVSAQLIWLLLFFIALVIVRSAGKRIAESGAVDRSQRAAFSGLITDLNAICDRLELLSGAEIAALRQQAGRLREDMKYSTHDSLPAAGPFDNQLAVCFVEINTVLDSFERDSSDNTVVETASRQIQIARQTLKRREDATAHART
jgi:hypothetical protein